MLPASAARSLLAGLFALIGLANTGVVMAESESLYTPPVVQPRTARIEMTFETLEMPDPGETMGMGGFGFLLDLNENLYVGAKGYGAFTGKRGGFFTAGVVGGIQHDLSPRLRLDTGIFLGGGGGGVALVGGGAMLRPHVGLSYALDGYRLGLQYTWDVFPNGDIDSKQLGMSLELPIALQFGQGGDWGRSLGAGGVSRGLARHEYGLFLDSYRPASGSKTLAGLAMETSMKAVGAEFRRQIDDHLDWSFRLAGAGGGNADGYAEVFIGAGYRLPLGSERLTARFSGALGAGGGGTVDVGGGTMGRAGVELGLRLSRDLKIGASVGLLKAFDGSFQATTYGLNAAILTDSAIAGGPRPLEVGERLQLTRWRWRVGNQTMFDPARKQAGIDQPVHMVGLKADLMPGDDSFYLTGQAYGAYDGDAGGYAVGLTGVGWRWPILGKRLWATAEATVGAAGGGGIAVGGGAIVQGLAGIEYNLSPNFAAVASVGRIQSFEGGLSSNLADISLAYQFTTPGRRAAW